MDALDQCQNSNGTRHQVLARLQELQAGQDVRLLITSRLIPAIEGVFREAAKLEIRANDEDVRQFVAGQIYRLPECIQCDNSLQEIVKERIVQLVDGMSVICLTCKVVLTNKVLGFSLLS